MVALVWDDGHSQCDWRPGINPKIQTNKPETFNGSHCTCCLLFLPTRAAIILISPAYWLAFLDDSLLDVREVWQFLSLSLLSVIVASSGKELIAQKVNDLIQGQGNDQ